MTAPRRSDLADVVAKLTLGTDEGSGAFALLKPERVPVGPRVGWLPQDRTTDSAVLCALRNRSRTSTSTTACCDAGCIPGMTGVQRRAGAEIRVRNPYRGGATPHGR
jgi:hypothetical protein